MARIKMKITAGVLALMGTMAWASPISSVAKTVIPSEAQQIISVDYRTVRSSDTALALKAQALPGNLKEFESALKDVNIDPDKDVESVTFASFRDNKGGLNMIGVASGSFSSKTVLKKLAMKAEKPVKYRDSSLYAISSKMGMTFLDDNTLLFGNDNALRAALNARDGLTAGLDSNQELTEMIGSIEKATVWSVLNQRGSQDMLGLALGDARKLPDYLSIEPRVLSSHYAMNFANGVKFDLHVVTSDTQTSSDLSSLLKMGVLYKKVTSTPVQKTALDNMTVKSDRSELQMQFKADRNQLQSLLRSKFFATVSPAATGQREQNQ
jgi:hypothetical protein